MSEQYKYFVQVLSVLKKPNKFVVSLAYYINFSRSAKETSSFCPHLTEIFVTLPNKTPKIPMTFTEITLLKTLTTMKKALLFAFVVLMTASMQAQTARKFTLDLTEDGKAQMVCFLPQQPSGKAIVGVPGGGYSMLSNTHEGTMASEWLNNRGIAYFVVNYRLPQGDRTKPMGDVEQGIRIVRDSAKGFSAGGHLASVISTHADFDVRPDFSILFYPVISMDERLSHKWSCINFLGEEGQKNPELVRDFSTQNAVRSHLTPPALIITANNDPLVPPVTNAIQYYNL